MKTRSKICLTRRTCKESSGESYVGVYKYHTHRVIIWGEQMFKKLCEGDSQDSSRWRRHASNFKLEQHYTQRSVRSIIRCLSLLAREGVTMPDSIYRNLQTAIQFRKNEYARLCVYKWFPEKPESWVNVEAIEGHQWIIESLEELLVLFNRGPRIRLSILGYGEDFDSVQRSSVWELNEYVAQPEYDKDDQVAQPEESSPMADRLVHLVAETIDD
ncbi:hypothetical protein IV203_033127 [Nitzschia inconspicua]|uniref:Uncharacterized protein n=1 Tax=Nitzschia inconspicua TaxID=303405 RepID=A0A9K3PG83_9STRA|nr:hypothetical protein IV203_033127 [Nitzschia inconspicua]